MAWLRDMSAIRRRRTVSPSGNAFDAVRTLTTEQRLIASGAAFATALLIGIAIDGIWGAGFGVGVARMTWQAVLTLAIWLPLIPLLRSLRRALLQRTAGTWSFADAFEHVWKTVHARSESTPEAVRFDSTDSTSAAYDGGDGRRRHRCQ